MVIALSCAAIAFLPHYSLRGICWEVANIKIFIGFDAAVQAMQR